MAQATADQRVLPTTGALGPVVAEAQANFNALFSQSAGPGAPPSATKGMPWLDTSSSTLHLLKIFDGAQWVTIGAMNPTDHSFIQPISAGGTGGKTLAEARANLGISWETIAEIDAANVASIIFTGLVGFDRIRINGTVYPSVATPLYVQLSADNGATFFASPGDYVSSFVAAQAANLTPDTNASTSGLPLTHGANVAASPDAACLFDIQIGPLSGTRTMFKSEATATLTGVYRSWNYGKRTATVSHNALRIIGGAGTLTGGVTLEGIRA